MAAVSCAPCAFGAVSPSLLSFPLTIATISVSIAPTISYGNDSQPTTIFVTSTLSPLTTATTPPGAPPVTTITYTGVDQLTWTTLGTTLSFPTTYVEYFSFVGAAVAGSGCASTIPPTPVTIPAGVPSASLLYPLDRTGALPSGLISYLDSIPGVLNQLKGIRLETCDAVGAIGVSATATSVTLTQTSTLGTTQTVETTIPPPTTYTTTRSSTITKTEVVAATNPVTNTAIISLTTFGGPTVVVSGGMTTTVPLQSQVNEGKTTVLPLASPDLSSLLALLSSKSVAARQSSSGIYTNSTSAAGTTTGNTVLQPSKTASASAYTGAATQTSSMSKSFLWNVLGSLGFVVLL